MAFLTGAWGCNAGDNVSNDEMFLSIYGNIWQLKFIFNFLAVLFYFFGKNHVGKWKLFVNLMSWFKQK